MGRTRTVRAAAPKKPRGHPFFCQPRDLGFGLGTLMQTTATLTALLRETLQAPVKVELGRSRTRPVQAKALRPGTFAQAGVALRLHRVFLNAPDEIIVDMGQWLKVGRRARQACARLDAWMHGALEALPPTAPRQVTLRAEGHAHHLEDLQREVIEAEFPDRFALPPREGELPLGDPADSAARLACPSMTWGRASTRKRIRSLRLGSYVSESNLIRIHPHLDRTTVPARFVRYIVFHEHLHALYPSHKDPAGRWVHHTRAFRQREARYPDYEWALRWERDQLFRVLARR